VGGHLGDQAVALLADPQVQLDPLPLDDDPLKLFVAPLQLVVEPRKLFIGRPRLLLGLMHLPVRLVELQVHIPEGREHALVGTGGGRRFVALRGGRIGPEKNQEPRSRRARGLYRDHVEVDGASAEIVFEARALPALSRARLFRAPDEIAQLGSKAPARQAQQIESDRPWRLLEVGAGAAAELHDVQVAVDQDAAGGMTVEDDLIGFSLDRLGGGTWSCRRATGRWHRSLAGMAQALAFTGRSHVAGRKPPSRGDSWLSPCQLTRTACLAVIPAIRSPAASRLVMPRILPRNNPKETDSIVFKVSSFDFCARRWHSHC
jgi:hypothetical protein